MVLPTLWRTSRPSMWDDMLNVRRDFDRVVDRFFTGSAAPVNAWMPRVDVRETEEDIVVSAELPGMTKDDVQVTVENGVLTISGEKKQEREEKKEGGYHVTERCYGKFERAFALPRSVDQENVKAKFENGVLDVTLAKIPAAKPRLIPVK